MNNSNTHVLSAASISSTMSQATRASLDSIPCAAVIFKASSTAAEASGRTPREGGVAEKALALAAKEVRRNERKSFMVDIVLRYY